MFVNVIANIQEHESAPAGRRLDLQSRRLLILAREQRRDAAYGDAPVCPFGRLGRDFQILLAIVMHPQKSGPT